VTTALLVLKVFKAIKVFREILEVLVLQAHKENQDLLAPQELKVKLDLPDLKAIQVLPALKEILVIQDQQDHKAIKVIREMLVLLVLLAILGLLALQAQIQLLQALLVLLDKDLHIPVTGILQLLINLMMLLPMKVVHG
jgi:hypothetical protein